jgi:hypothetical protein
MVRRDHRPDRVSAREARSPKRIGFLLGVSAIACIAVLVHIVGGVVIGKTHASNRDLRLTPSFLSSHSGLRTFALHYASAPSAALRIQVDTSMRVGTPQGCALLLEACSILRHLGAEVEPVRCVGPFVYFPLSRLRP